MKNGAMRWMMAAGLMLALTASASAQSGPGGGSGAAGGVPGSSGGSGGLAMPGLDIGGTKTEDPATVERRKEIERQYRDATQRIPVQASGANDPWANMRGADEVKPAKPAAKTAPKKKSAAQ